MDYAQDTITHSTTGAKTWTIGFQAKEVEFRVVPGPLATFTDPRWSYAIIDVAGGNQVTDSVSIYSSRRQERYTDRCASIWTWNGSTWTEAFKITWDSVTATTVEYTVNTASSTYQVERIARA